MTNKTFKCFISSLNFLILATATAFSVTAQTADVIVESARARANQKHTLIGHVRWPKSFGVPPRGSRCGQFYVAALDPNNGNKPVEVASTDDGRDDGEFYTCKYTMRLPSNRRYYVIASMGGSLLLPKEDPSAEYKTDAWVGGTSNKPRRGYERGFAGKFVTIGTRDVYLKFDMYYAQVDPN
jgi:hypothetical protein